MTTLADDLVILTVGTRPKTGPKSRALPAAFSFGLRGAELVSLAMAGRVEVTAGRIVVRDRTPLGDAALDWALSDIAAAAYPPAAALAGMAHAAGLGELCFAGRENAGARERLGWIAAGDRTARAAAGAAAVQADSANQAARSGVESTGGMNLVQDKWMQAASRAATEAATNAAVRAATDAAVHSAVNATIGAAVAAAGAAGSAAGSAHHSAHGGHMDHHGSSSGGFSGSSDSSGHSGHHG